MRSATHINEKEAYMNGYARKRSNDHNQTNYVITKQYNYKDIKMYHPYQLAESDLDIFDESLPNKFDFKSIDPDISEQH